MMTKQSTRPGSPLSDSMASPCEPPKRLGRADVPSREGAFGCRTTDPCPIAGDCDGTGPRPRSGVWSEAIRGSFGYAWLSRPSRIVPERGVRPEVERRAAAGRTEILTPDRHRTRFQIDISGRDVHEADATRRFRPVSVPPDVRSMPGWRLNAVIPIRRPATT